MNTLGEASLALFILFLCPSAAQTEPLTRASAVKLIAEAEQIRVNEFVVGPMRQVDR
jgi:hypothetical protein